MLFCFTLLKYLFTTYPNVLPTFQIESSEQQLYIEQYCTSSQHALQLENIFCYLLLKYYHCFKLYWLNLCCCCCYHCQLAVMWIRDHIFTDLKFDDPYHGWESCTEVLNMCISLQLVNSFDYQHMCLHLDLRGKYYP